MSRYRREGGEDRGGLVVCADVRWWGGRRGIVSHAIEDRPIATHRRDGAASSDHRRDPKAVAGCRSVHNAIISRAMQQWRRDLTVDPHVAFRVRPITGRGLQRDWGSGPGVRGASRATRRVSPPRWPHGDRR